MGAESFYSDIMSGRAGAWAAPMRWALSALSAGYARAVARRNRRFEGGESEVIRLPVPVISIGNITTGGTGKTPLVIDFVKRCLRRERNPAVVARGYKSGTHQVGDELQMVSERLPDVPCVGNPDRVAGGRQAVTLGADVIVLDDAFQHRRIARDLDVVVVEATNPFGFGHVLPRGLLREPLDGLRRADLIVVSRADQVDSSVRQELTARLASIAPEVPVVKCQHRPTGLTDISGGPCEVKYGRAVVFAAVGNPQGFVGTLRQMGIEPAKCVWWPDHHRYTAADVAKLAATAGGVEHDVVLTTHKDAVKLRGLVVEGLEPLRVVRIDIEFLEGGEALVDARLDSVLSPTGGGRRYCDAIESRS